MSENNTTIIENRKKSALGAKGHFDYEKLVYQIEGFLPSTYEEELEEIIFTYEIAGMKITSEISAEEKEMQYQFLINFSKLSHLLETYKISFAEENIYYDTNFLPYIKERDLYHKGEKAEQNAFLEIYKMVIGGILSKKYNVKKLQESGLEILKAEESFRAFYEANSVEELIVILEERKEKYLQNIKQKMVRVKKSANTVKTTVAILSSILLLVTTGYAAYMSIIVVPFQEKVIEAFEGYTANDYVVTIDSMQGIEPEQMDISTKYILAISYARSENLRREELEDIVSKLSLNSNERELQYWIHLGRLESQEAQNLAKALSNDQLLIYAYMKELNYLESNTAIEGEEKQSRISTLEQEIRTLGEKYTNDTDDVAPTEVEIETEVETETENKEVEAEETDGE